MNLKKTITLNLKILEILTLKTASKKNLFILAGMFFAIFSVSANAQQTVQTPVPATTPSQQDINRQMEQNRKEDQERRQTELKQRQLQNEMNRTRQEMMITKNMVYSLPEKLRKDIDTLYRKTNKRELKILAVSSDDARRYESFLKKYDRTGLIKLVEDLGCSENPNVLVATEDCLKYSMPGGGSSYSFRVKDYRIPRLSDLTFADNIFQVMGKLTHGILTGIGNVPLEKVSLQSPGVKYLVDFKPVTKLEDAVSIDKNLTVGFVKDNFLYQRKLKAVDNMTYVLRSIAYEGELNRAVNGITYNELDFDKRRDIIIAFRIVSREPDKSVTILWKELENKDAPRIKKKSEDQQKDKENNFVAKERNWNGIKK